MSKDMVKQMFGKIEKDAALKTMYAQLMQAHQQETEKALADKLIELGKTSGFAFSNEDLMSARAELADKSNSNMELSDGDLANVAGGNAVCKAMVGVTTVLSYGIGCIVYGLASIVFEVGEKGNCGNALTTTTKCP